MCGIVGIWSNSDIKLQQKHTSIVLDKQHHRGPDNRQKITIDDITLGHNRLSIIDLSAKANQPFISNCKRYYIIFNGEIYNYIELKKDLDYRFKTHSDTEVLLASYIAYGDRCLAKLNGMFAFAIYDKQQKILFCARDRIGEKPFVYSTYNNNFYFASELAALYSIGIFPDTKDEIGIHYSYLRNYRHIPEPYTKYQHIKRLEPAYAIIIKDRKIIKKWCYWEPTMDYDSSITKSDVYHIIDDAVKIRQRADVEVATLLSGGVDSSVITALMVKHGLKPKAFTLRSDDDELARAKTIAKLLNISLQVFEYDKNFQQHLAQEMFTIYGEEVRLLPLTHAARLYQQIAKENIKVVLNGNGADEIFYGYDGSNKQLLFSDMLRIVELLPKSFLKMFVKIFSSNKNLALLFTLAQMKNNKRKGFLYQQEAAQKGLTNHNYNSLCDFWSDKVKAKYYIDHANWLGLISEDAHSITIAGDLPAMMYNIETRAPFLDHRVVELAFKIDAHRKIAKKNGKANNKLILKQAFENILPKKVLYASKKGFGYGIKDNIMN